MRLWPFLTGGKSGGKRRPLDRNRVRELVNRNRAKKGMAPLPAK